LTAALIARRLAPRLTPLFRDQIRDPEQRFDLAVALRARPYVTTGGSAPSSWVSGPAAADRDRA
jgi:hypothetical protein